MSNVGGQPVLEWEDLIQLNLEGVRLYQRGLDQLSGSRLHQTLAEFQDEHRRQAWSLREALRGQGQAEAGGARVKLVVARVSPRWAGPWVLEGALRRLWLHEARCHRAYQQASCCPHSAGLTPVLERHRALEQHRLLALEEAIQFRIWEECPSGHSAQRASEEP